MTRIPPRPETGLGEAELERLFAKLEKPMYNVVFRYVWEAEEAHDLVQEAFVRLWHMRDRVRLDTVEALLWRIAVNQASKRRRSRRLWQWMTLDEDVWTSPVVAADLALSANERDAAVRRAVDALPERQRAVMTLCAFSGLSYAEVASVLDIPEGTVASRRHQALATLRQTLGADHG